MFHAKKEREYNDTKFLQKYFVCAYVARPCPYTPLKNFKTSI